MKVWTLGLALLPTMLNAAPADAGRPAAQLKQGFGARALGMGRSTGAGVGDAFTFTRDVASLAGLKLASLGAQQAYVPVERETQYIGFARPISGADSKLFYGAALGRASLARPIERRTANTPEPAYTFGESRFTVHLAACGWALPEALALGAGFRYLNHQLGDAQGGGYAFDLGARYVASPWLSVGLSLQDFQGRMTWNTGSVEDLALGLREAVSLSLSRSLIVNAEIEQSFTQRMDFRVRSGAEWNILKERLAIRGGYDDGALTAGLGLRTRLFEQGTNFDYAISTESGVDGWLQHRLSLTLEMDLEDEEQIVASR